MIDGIADDMRDRIAQTFDDGLVDLRVLARASRAGPSSRSWWELADETGHALEHGLDRLGAHRHHGVLELARMMEDVLQRLRQSATDLRGQLLNDLAEHRLRDDHFADHVDDAVDPFELDPDGHGRPGPRRGALGSLRARGGVIWRRLAAVPRPSSTAGAEFGLERRHEIGGGHELRRRLRGRGKVGFADAAGSRHGSRRFQLGDFKIAIVDHEREHPLDVLARP